MRPRRFSTIDAGAQAHLAGDAVNPGGTETDNDGIDQDCDGYETITTDTSEGCTTFGGAYQGVIVTASLYTDLTAGMDNAINIYESGTSGDSVTATLWNSSGYDGLYLVTNDGGTRTHEDRLTTLSAGTYDIVLTVGIDTSEATLQWGTSEATESISYMSSLSAGGSVVSSTGVYVSSLEMGGCNNDLRRAPAQAVLVRTRRDPRGTPPPPPEIPRPPWTTPTSTPPTSPNSSATARPAPPSWWRRPSPRSTG